VVGEEHYPFLVIDFFLQVLAEHAFTVFVVMVQSLLEPLPHLM